MNAKKRKLLKDFNMMLDAGFTKIIRAENGCPLKRKPHICANCKES